MLRIYWIYLKTALALQFQYRVAMGIYMIGRILEPLIYLVVWTAVATAKGGVAGYQPEDFAAYYIVLMVVNQFTFTWIMYEFSFRIRSGDLSSLLLKPIHPIHSDIADNIGYKILMLVIIFPAAAILTFLFKPAFRFELENVLLFVPALALAFMVRFLVEWSTALVAFWMTRIDAVNQMYSLLILFLSGRMVPLDLLPYWAERTAWYLPFRWSIAFPVELLLGRLTTRETMVGLGMQTVWLALGYLLVRTLWRWGVRKYSAVGS